MKTRQRVTAASSIVRWAETVTLILGKLSSKTDKAPGTHSQQTDTMSERVAGDERERYTTVVRYSALTATLAAGLRLWDEMSGSQSPQQLPNDAGAAHGGACFVARRHARKKHSHFYLSPAN
jgi:hypothetical protein